MIIDVLPDPVDPTKPTDSPLLILNEIFFNKMEFMLDKSILTQKKVYKKSKLINLCVELCILL